jgi:hypothetical protein
MRYHATVVAILSVGLICAAPAPQDQAGKRAPKPPPSGDAADDPGAKEDLAKVQGTWAAEVRDRQGKPAGRIIKYIDGNREMVVEELADGKIASAHRVQFRVTRQGPVRLFTFFNGEVTEGPRTGQKMGSFTYIYKVDNERFTEVMGMLIGQERQAPTARVYKRVENPEPPAPPPTATPDEPDPK